MPSQPLQVRLPETVGVLEPVAEQAVDADVGEPDQRELHGEICVGEDARHAEDERAQGRVSLVVGGRAARGPAR